MGWLIKTNDCGNYKLYYISRAIKKYFTENWSLDLIIL